MPLVRSLALALALALLMPGWAWAAPPAQPGAQDPTCYGVQAPDFLLDTANSFGIPLAASDSREVTVGGAAVTLHICAPFAHRNRAREVLDLLARALPALAAHAGPRDHGPPVRRIIMAPPDEWAAPDLDGYQRVADGVIFLHSGSTNWTVIHEAAHYWAHPDAFAEEWMVEGYADYLTGLAVADLGVPYAPLLPIARCDGLRLRDWSPGPGYQVHCAYSLGAETFQQLAAAVTPEALRVALQQLSEGGGADSLGLLVALELRSGRALDQIFRTAVFRDAELDLVGLWARVRDQYWEVQTLAADLGVPLPWRITRAIQDWSAGVVLPEELHTVGAMLATSASVLERARDVRQLCEQLQLACRRPWETLAAGELPSADLDAELWTARQLLERYAELAAASAAAGLAPPAALQSATAQLDGAQVGRVQLALQLLRQGQALDALCEELEAGCAGWWQARWAAAELEALEQESSALARLLAHAQDVERRCGDLLAHCRSAWHASLASGQAPAAEQTLTQIEALVPAASATTQACAQAGLDCGPLWAPALASGDLDQARARLDAVSALLPQANWVTEACRAHEVDCAPQLAPALESGDAASVRATLNALQQLFQRADDQAERCAAAGITCAASWKAAFHSGGGGAAQQAIDKLDVCLTSLADIDTTAADAQGPLAGLTAGALRFAVQGIRDEARGAVANCDPTRAAELATRARGLAQAALWLRAGLPLAVCLAAAVVSLSLWWRSRPQRTVRRRPAPDDLLADLLARPPNK